MSLPALFNICLLLFLGRTDRLSRDKFGRTDLADEILADDIFLRFRLHENVMGLEVELI